MDAIGYQVGYAIGWAIAPFLALEVGFLLLALGLRARRRIWPLALATPAAALLIATGLLSLHLI